MEPITQSQQPQTKPANLGSVIDLYRGLYEQRAALNAEAKELTKQMEAMVPEILGQLDDLGLDSAKGKYANIRIEEKIRPNVKDWDAFYHYIGENDAWFLLERRPTSIAFAEMVKAGEEVPGVEAVHLRDIVCKAN